MNLKTVITLCHCLAAVLMRGSWSPSRFLLVHKQVPGEAGIEDVLAEGHRSLAWSWRVSACERERGLLSAELYQKLMFTFSILVTASPTGEGKCTSHCLGVRCRSWRVPHYHRVMLPLAPFRKELHLGKHPHIHPLQSSEGLGLLPASLSES